MSLIDKLQTAIETAGQYDAELVRQLVVILDDLKLHETDVNNPHRLHKRNLHLSRVQNFAPAKKNQAEQGRNNNVVMTPKRTMNFMDANIYDPLTTLFDSATDSIV